MASALGIGGVLVSPLAASADYGDYYFVTGTLVTTTGTPVTGVNVELSQGSTYIDGTTSDLDGSFEIDLTTDDNPTGDYLLSVHGSGYAYSRTVHLEADVENTNDLGTIAVGDGPRFSVSGRADTNEVGLQANLYRATPGGVALALQSSVVVGQFGRFTLTEASPDFLYVVSISDPQGAYPETFYVDEAGSKVVHVDSHNLALTKPIALPLNKFTNATIGISGTAAAFSTVTTSLSLAPDASLITYDWYSGGVRILGAHESSYRIKSTDEAKPLVVRATVSRRGYQRTVVESPPVTVPARQRLYAYIPTISGTAKVGETLKAHPHGWAPGTTLSYRWFANGKALKGATGTSYTVKRSLVGKKITVRIIGKQAGYLHLVKVSKATKKVKK